MQLISLKIFHNSEIIRYVPFKDGINIITNIGEHGNQIGKSTALRAISFCLGSDGKNMWKDPDNGNINTDVRNFILNENITFELTIKGSVTHVLRRKLYEVSQKSRKVIKTEGWVDDVHLTSQDKYKDALAKAVFGYQQNKPSFNSIKNKFMRIDRLTSNNAYKYLNVHTSNDEYTIIYSALFGFEGHDLLKKDVLIKDQINKKETRRSAFLDGADLISIKDEIEKLDIEIEFFRNKESQFDMSGVQDKVINNLKSHREKIANLSLQIADLETRLIYNKRTIKKYHENIVEIDIKKVNSIYLEAINQVPNINKTLEQTIQFHNSIFMEKAKQSEKRTGILVKEIELNKSLLEDAISSEQNVIKELSSEGQLSGFIVIEKEIQQLSEKKGRLSFITEEIKTLNLELRRLELDLQKLKDKIELLTKSLTCNIDKFNVFFKALTRQVFKTHANSLNVSTDENSDLRFSIVNSDKNTGDGAPRAEAMAFDICLVEYMRLTNSRLPHFSLQDYLESVDDEKLNILIQYASKHKIQIVISILNDKLQLLPIGFLKKNTVLELSVNDKFFKV